MGKNYLFMKPANKIVLFDEFWLTGKILIIIKYQQMWQRWIIRKWGRWLVNLTVYPSKCKIRLVLLTKIWKLTENWLKNENVISIPRLLPVSQKRILYEMLISTSVINDTSLYLSFLFNREF